MTQKGSDLLVRALENEGVERIFAVPGEENLDVLESLRTSTIELVLMRHEQPAAFMAATYGRLTGKPGVVLTTLGPGATNLTTAAAYAQLERTDLVGLGVAETVPDRQRLDLERVRTRGPEARPADGIVGGGSVTDNPNRFIYYPSHPVPGSPGGVVLAQLHVGRRRGPLGLDGRRRPVRVRPARPAGGGRPRRCRGR
jgi:thiamine pyrophosphate-dependent enzyme